MPAIDINRKSTNVIFDKEISSEIITKTIDESAILQLGTTMEIAGNGKKYQTITSDPEPEWVGETEAKPVGKSGNGIARSMI
jgi:HK97 family phage major capsid protein